MQKVRKTIYIDPILEFGSLNHEGFRTKKCGIRTFRCEFRLLGLEIILHPSFFMTIVIFIMVSLSRIYTS